MALIVLIVSRTKMTNGVCVGEILEATGELIRIHDNYGRNLKEDAPYKIGDRYLMDVQTPKFVRNPPHIEDKQTNPVEYIGNIGVQGIIDFIHAHNLGNRLVDGPIESTFQGYLNFEGNKNFINHKRIPAFSTQFWIADKDLIHNESFGKHYYHYGDKRLPFVGLQPTVPTIPAGTIIRLSLAHWWGGDGSGEERCYLQLSGWYL